ncbi:MAG: methyltransferase domain-containing protein [Spirochaeta sp.]|nr:methyltransferase domain-containing protein [Spirochaeta sp.]
MESEHLEPDTINEPFEDFAELYEVTHGEKDDDHRLYSEYAAEIGSPILEVGCGTGRIILRLAREGHSITGIDLSKGMLEIARQKLLAESEEVRSRVRLEQQDMTELDLPGQKFNLVMMPYAEFAHILTYDRQRYTLDRIAEHMLPGGLLVISMSNWDPKEVRMSYAEALKTWGKALPMTYEGVFVDERRELRITRYIARGYDPSVQIALHVYIHEISKMDGTVVARKMNPLSLRYVFPNEMRLLLEGAGFDIKDIFGSYDRAALDFQSRRMIFVARRRSNNGKSI